jgi:glycerate 2-kinase
VSAVDPVRLVSDWHARNTQDHIFRTTLDVVAAGKAAWPMARAFGNLAGDRVHRVVVAAPQAGTPQDLAPSFDAFNAGHPSPNEDSMNAAARALAIAREGAEAGRALLVLLSGGASALMALPVAGLRLDDKTAAASALMRAGVAIDGLNCVRKHLSMIKGGRLGAAARQSLTLALSDVHGPVPDDPAVIGSGPTVADPTTFDDALRIVTGVEEVPRAVREYLGRGAEGQVPETVKPGDVSLRDARFVVIGNRTTALDGAGRCAESLGYTVFVRGEATSGEARESSARFVQEARRAAGGGSRPLCVLAAGETTVTVKGRGRGGRNQEFALAGVPLMGSLGRAAVLASAGTDGMDGPTDAAGALVDSSTLDRAARLGLDGAAALADNDAYPFFEALGDLIVWGPTGTNVGDVHVLLVG